MIFGVPLCLIWLVEKFDVRRVQKFLLVHATCCKILCSVCLHGRICSYFIWHVAKHDVRCALVDQKSSLFHLALLQNMIYVVACPSYLFIWLVANLLQNMMFGVPPCTGILVTSFGLFRNMIFDSPRASNFWLFHLTYWKRWCHFWLFHLTLCPCAWEFLSFPSDMSQISVPACKEFLVTPLDSLQNIIFGVPPYFIWLWLSVCPRTSFKYNFK